MEEEAGVSCRIVAKDELECLLSHPHLPKGVVLLVLANKMDLPSALAADELAEQLQLQRKQLVWQMFATNAVTGEGVKPAMEWLSSRLSADG